jgi:hypothetical protein
MRLDSIDPTGTLMWETPALAGGDSLATRALFLGANDRAHVLGRTTISAIEADGQPSPGWPVELAPVFNWNFTGIALDDGRTTVFSSLGVFGACFGSCDKIVAGTNHDGSPRWQNYYPQDGPAHGIVPGPNGRLFTIATANRPTRTLIGLDPLTGAEVCSSPSSYYLIGGPQAVFTSSENQVTAFDGNCQGHGVYTSTYANTNVLTYVEGWAVGIEFPAFPDSRHPRLFGVTADGTTWQNNEIVPDVALAPVRGTSGSSVYVVGADALDYSVQKLFELDATSGQIRRRIFVAGICTYCGVAVAPDSTIYINDLSSTRIFRMPK